MENNIMEFIRPELMILIIGIWFFGAKLKNTNRIQDWIIPFILMAVAMGMSAAYLILQEGFSGMAVWIGITQGWVISAIADQGYNFKKQLFYKRDEDMKNMDSQSNVRSN